MITIAVVNLKGGTSKSSTSFHLGGVLAARGHRILLCDCDPQSSLTFGFWGACPDLDPRRTIAAVWSGDPLPEQVVWPSGIAGISLLPGHDSAASANMIPAREWGSRVESVRDLLAQVREDYDYVICDCPPNLHLCSHAAIAAADEVVTPTQAEDFSSRGLVAVSRAVRGVQERRGRPGILGYLLTMHDRRLAIHQVYESSLRAIYGDLVFGTTIPYAAAYKEAVAARKPIGHYKPRSPAAKAFASLADEIVVRLEARNVAPNAA